MAGERAMQTTEDTRMMDPSKLADRRGAPLAEMPILSMVTLDELRYTQRAAGRAGGRI